MEALDEQEAHQTQNVVGDYIVCRYYHPRAFLRTRRWDCATEWIRYSSVRYRFKRYAACIVIPKLCTDQSTGDCDWREDILVQEGSKIVDWVLAFIDGNFNKSIGAGFEGRELKYRQTVTRTWVAHRKPSQQQLLMGTPLEAFDIKRPTGYLGREVTSSRSDLYKHQNNRMKHVKLYGTIVPWR